MMPMGRGTPNSVSRKHKLKVASSMNEEHASIGHVLGLVMWCKYFMEAHGSTIENNLYIKITRLLSCWLKIGAYHLEKLVNT